MSKITIMFDGASKSNPGISGAGYVFYNGETEILTGGVHCGIKTNNEAEYMGMIVALEQAKKMNFKNVHVKGDSNLVIKQMTGEFKIRSPKLFHYYSQAKELVEHFDSIEFEHVRREFNKRADAVANEYVFM